MAIRQSHAWRTWKANKGKEQREEENQTEEERGSLGVCGEAHLGTRKVGEPAAQTRCRVLPGEADAEGSTCSAWLPRTNR